MKKFLGLILALSCLKLTAFSLQDIWIKDPYSGAWTVDTVSDVMLLSDPEINTNVVAVEAFLKRNNILNYEQIINNDFESKRIKLNQYYLTNHGSGIISFSEEPQGQNFQFPTQYVHFSSLPPEYLTGSLSHFEQEADLPAIAAGGGETVDRSFIDSWREPAGVAKYRGMLRRGASNEEILTELLAPWQVNQENIQKLVPIESKQDINNMDVLDFLLEKKFNEPKGTIDKMYPYFKIVDVKRQLLPYKSRYHYDFEIPFNYNPAACHFPYKGDPKPRNQIFSRPWIEFPSSTLPRHLDYNKKGELRVIFLLNSDTFNNTNSETMSPYAAPNDYSYIKRYNDISSYYWSKDGLSFFLVKDNGQSQLYNGMTGEPIGAQVQAMEEIKIEEADEDLAEDSASSASVSPEPGAAPSVPVTGFNTKGAPLKFPTESEAHFRARLKAKLNMLGNKYSTQVSDTDILARAIIALDNKTFNILKDTDISLLRDTEEWIGSIGSILNQDPTTATMLDKAKAYVAIHNDLVNSSDPRVVFWKQALEDIELASAGIVDLGATTKIKLKVPIKFDASIYGQTLGRFDLSASEQTLLFTPTKYIRSLDRLFKQDPAKSDQLTQAKIFMALKSNWIDPEDERSNPDVIKWIIFFNA